MHKQEIKIVLLNYSLEKLKKDFLIKNKNSFIDKK